MGKKNKKKNSFRDKYKKQKKDIVDRQERHTEDAGGQQWGTIFRKENFPNEMEVFTCGKGKHKIDIIPFIAGKDHPTEAEGNIIFTLALRVHQNIGPGDKQYVCPSYTYGKPCPICEHLKANPQLSDDERSAIAAKRRNIFLIWDHSDQEKEDKGVQIWNASFFMIKEKLDELQLDDDGGIIAYYDIEEGKHVAWTRKGEGKKNTQYLGHKFVERDDPVIPDEILDEADIVVDEELINMRPEYEEIYENFHGEPTESSYSKKNAAEMDDDDDDDPDDGNDDKDIPDDKDDDDDLKCPDDDGEFGVDWDELKTCRKCEIYDECEKKKDGDDGDDDDDDDDDPDDLECPEDEGEFGKSFDELDECEECDIRDECESENEEIEKTKKEAKKKKAAAKKKKQKSEDKKEKGKGKSSSKKKSSNRLKRPGR